MTYFRKRLVAGAFVAFGLGLLMFARQCAHTQTPDAALPPPGVLRTGQAAFGGWTTDAPGVRRHIALADLPAPYATPSADHGAQMVPRPSDAWPKAPAGFEVQQYATRICKTRARSLWRPNGDLFIAESGAGRIHVLRGVSRRMATPSRTACSPKGLHQPFGIAFYPHGPNPQWVYVGDTDAVVALPLPQRRHPGARPRRDDRSGHPRRRPAARRRALDARRRVHKMTTKSCSSRLAPIPMWMRWTTIRWKYHRADILEYNPRWDRAFAFTPRASGIPSAWLWTRRRAPSGHP